MNYDSLHFILVFNAPSSEAAKEIATKELKQYGVRNFKNPDWFLIGTDKSWSIDRANRTVNKWIMGKFTEYINELVDNVDHGKVEISNLKIGELKVITRHYENRLEANRFRKANDKQPFDMMKGHEFNAGKFNEFGVTQVVNSQDGETTYLVAVYCDIEQFKY